ncbi:NADP-dependent oxidoreductase domain-containing protein [Diaporthe sp. PMI_573]|nr:NADP-dependent oxidoreductase domain-containing protein [Diaporthaceae sp. PMI_573]
MQTEICDTISYHSLCPLRDCIPHTGFSLLGLTWRPTKTPDERAFSTMKAAVENGATIWSSSSVYGMAPEPRTAGLSLLRRYFEKYPEDASKVTLFIRACFDPVNFVPTCTRDGVRASWDECDQILGGVKRIDVFGPARIDQNVRVEEKIGALKELRMKARSVPLVCNVSLLTYAPLGYGFPTGAVKKLEDIPKGDMRHMFGRFQPEHFVKNLKLVDEIEAFAKAKGVTAAQVALAWIRTHSDSGDCTLIKLSAVDKKKVDDILARFDVAGHRQIPGMESNLWT